MKKIIINSKLIATTICNRKKKERKGFCATRNKIRSFSINRSLLLWFFSPFLLYFGCFRLKSKQISNETYERGRERERKKIPVIKYFIYSIHKLSIDVYIWERILIFTFFFLVTNLNIFQEKKCFQMYSEQSEKEKKSFFTFDDWSRQKPPPPSLFYGKNSVKSQKKKCWCWSNHFQFHFNQSESIDSIDWLIGIELKSNMNIFFFWKCCCKKWI